MLSSNQVISDGVMLITITNDVILIVNHEKQINYNSVCIPLITTFLNFYLYIETKWGYIEPSLILHM